jgi:hypothetical protein
MSNMFRMSTTLSWLVTQQCKLTREMKTLLKEKYDPPRYDEANNKTIHVIKCYRISFWCLPFS